MITDYYVNPIFCPYKLSNSNEYHEWKKEIRRQEDSLIKRKWKYEIKMAEAKLDKLV